MVAIVLLKICHFSTYSVQEQVQELDLKLFCTFCYPTKPGTANISGQAQYNIHTKKMFSRQLNLARLM